jgi:nucleoid-associated protein YgaU
MGLFDFVKEAGEKLLGGKEARAEANQEMEQALKINVLKKMALQVENLQIDFKDGVATVRGETLSQSDKEKVVLGVGNTIGVARVDDQLTIKKPAPVVGSTAGAAHTEGLPAAAKEAPAVMYTVKSGDSLSKIAKQHYGSASKYMIIFEANKPMLKDPDKIYPGQTLRIPPLAK